MFARWIADKKGIECEDFIGNTTGKTITYWDGPTKRIRDFHIGSAGMTWQGVTWKVSHNKWAWKNVGGGLRDGQKLEGGGYCIFSDGGNTMTITGTLTLGGKKIAPLHDEYRRLSD
jgi:hypothetical protein